MNFSLPLNGSHTCVYFGAGHTYKQAMYGTELGPFPAPAPSSHEPGTPPRNGWKTRNGRRARGGAAPEKSQPRHVSDPSARAGLAGRCGQRLGTASCRQSRRRRSPGVPGGLAEWKSFPSSSKKEKFFLHLITPVAARRVGEWVGLGASKGGSGHCCVVGSRRRRALLPNPTLPSKTLS